MVTRGPNSVGLGYARRMTDSRSAFVLGARNLGGSIAGDLVEARIPGRGGGALRRLPRARARPRRAADHGGRDRSRRPPRAVAEAAAANGPASLFVNAVSAARPTGGPWGGGPVAEAGVDGIRQWCTPVAEQCALFLQVAATALREAGGRRHDRAGDGRLGAARDARPRRLGGRRGGDAGAGACGGAGAARGGHPRRAADRRRHDRFAEDRRPHRRHAGAQPDPRVGRGRGGALPGDARRCVA